MPRIKLAHWHEGKAPGSEVTVDAAQLKALQVDGRVAEVLDAKTAPPAAVSAPAVDASADAADKGRKKL